MPHSLKTTGRNIPFKRENQWRGKSEIKETGSTMEERQGNAQYKLQGSFMLAPDGGIQEMYF